MPLAGSDAALKTLIKTAFQQATASYESGDSDAYLDTGANNCNRNMLYRSYRWHWNRENIMSSSFKLDRNNNIINNSNFILVSDKAALIQDIKTRLYMYKGEYPYDKNKGIDYIDYMSKNNEQGLLAAIQSRILEDSRVSNVTFETAKESNNLKVVLTITGGEEVSFELE